MNIQPGVLCLVLKGPQMGSSVTALRPAVPGEVEAMLGPRFGMKADDILIISDTQIWNVDKPISWRQQYTGHETEIPFEAAGNLLPIPPLADPLDVTQSRELEHS